MLVCQCNVITDREIRQIVVDLLRDDPWRIIVPAMVTMVEKEKRERRPAATSAATARSTYLCELLLVSTYSISRIRL